VWNVKLEIATRRRVN